MCIHIAADYSTKCCESLASPSHENLIVQTSEGQKVNSQLRNTKLYKDGSIKRTEVEFIAEDIPTTITEGPFNFWGVRDFTKIDNEASVETQGAWNF